MRKLFLVVLVAFIGCFILAQTSFAATIAYEWSPGPILPPMSESRVGGPVLADDFIPIISGFVVQVDWWGSYSTFPEWELTFYNDEGAASPLFPFISQHVVGDVGLLDVPPDIFTYSAVWETPDVFINAGIPYWFSVANFGHEWTWATPVGGLHVGHSPDPARVWVGPPGPGVPWVFAPEPNYAFRVWVEDTSPVPIPGAVWLLGSGLLGLVGIRKKMKS